MALTAAEEAQTRELLAQQSAILSLADSEAAIISNLGATDVSLSDLTAATALNDADLMLVRQGTTDKSSAFSVIKSWFGIKTVANDTTFADNSVNPASTGWVRGAMLAISTSAGFVISLATNGYIKFPSWLGGLIIQWGTTPSLSSNYETHKITFPISFSSLYSCSVGTVIVSGNIGQIGVIGADPVITGFTAYLQTNGSISVFQGNWIAIGR